MMRKEFSIDAEWRSQVPEPVFDERPEYNRLYERTWELAHDHLLDLPGMPQTPYMDEAFCDVRIWIWDSCFMSLFCKYAPNCFPGVETLNNFYLPLYGSGRLPAGHRPQCAGVDRSNDRRTGGDQNLHRRQSAAFRVGRASECADDRRPGTSA